MSIRDRLDDAELLWAHGREAGALLSALVAVAAIAKQRYPNLGDRRGFEALLGGTHEWSIAIEFRGRLVDLDRFFYTWMRCELVHDAALPVDLRIDRDFADPATLTVRAGGEPERVVLLTPAWFEFFVGIIRDHLDSADDHAGGESSWPRAGTCSRCGELIGLGMASRTTITAALPPTLDACP